MSKIKKKSGGKAAVKSVKRAYKKRSDNAVAIDEHTLYIPGTDESSLLQIETNPPPVYRYNNPEFTEYLVRVDRTVAAIPVGQAFIVRADWSDRIARYLKVNYPKRKFLLRDVQGNDKVKRVYVLEYDKPVKRG